MDLSGLVAEYIERHKLLSPGEKVVVGVSGGADSCCIFHCLHSLGYEVVIAHLDHQLRTESAEEAQYVCNMGKSLGIETIMGKSEVRELAQNGFSLEEAARIARYRFLVKAAQDVGSMKLATGHTADDQIETVLMHFLRGAGPSGLRGMLPATKIEDWTHIDQVEGLILVRPLLDVRRAQTEAYCMEVGLETIEDPSNLDLTFFRNRIRHELIPTLREYNPGIERVILRTAKVMAGEASFLEAKLDENWNLLVTEENEGCIKFIQDKFEKMPLPQKRSFLRRVVMSLAPDSRDLGFDHIERAIDFLDSETISGKGQLPSGLEIFHLLDEVVIRKVGERLHFDQFPQMETLKSLDLELPSSQELARGWSLIAEKVALDDFNRAHVLSSLVNRTAAIDIHSLNGSLSLRTTIPGDRFQPLGMEGSVKVSDFFINRKIPHPAREYWPILCDNDGIVWVVGLRISNRVRISSDTTDIFLIRVEPPKEESI